MENLKLLSETLLDNYKITIDLKKECTRLLLGLASPLIASPSILDKDIHNDNLQRLTCRTDRLQKRRWIFFFSL